MITPLIAKWDFKTNRMKGIDLKKWRIPDDWLQKERTVFDICLSHIGKDILSGRLSQTYKIKPTKLKRDSTK